MPGTFKGTFLRGLVRVFRLASHPITAPQTWNQEMPGTFSGTFLIGKCRPPTFHPPQRTAPKHVTSFGPRKIGTLGLPNARHDGARARHWQSRMRLLSKSLEEAKESVSAGFTVATLLRARSPQVRVPLGELLRFVSRVPTFKRWTI
jgi:hypothetical protein